jgi:TrmH family RNA methyltransferase
MTGRRLQVTKKNAWFQRIEAIKRNRQKRQEEKLFLVEGVRPINQLVEAGGWELEAWIHSGGRDLSGWASTMLADHAAPTILELSPELLAELSDKEETSELLALVRIRAPALDTIRVDKHMLVALMDRPSSPGNLGSVMRACDAFGVHAVVISGHAVDPFDPGVIRASVGACFRLPVVHLCGNEQAVDWFDRLRRGLPSVQMVGTSARTDIAFTECDLTRPTVLLFGNETSGLSRFYKESCDALVNIPMCGTVSSLNLACAATVVLHECFRQRQGGSK